MTVPGGHPVGRHLPQLLDADGEELRMTRVSEDETPHQLFGEVAAHAVGEDRHFGVNVDAGLEARLPLPVLADAAVARAHAENPLAIHQEVGAGKSREQIDAFRFDETGEPLHERAQRDDVVAVVGERRRREREPDLAVRCEKIDAILHDRRRKRRTPGLEVGDQIA